MFLYLVIFYILLKIDAPHIIFLLFFTHVFFSFMNECLNGNLIKKIKDYEEKFYKFRK